MPAKRILLIEDEQIIHDLLSHVLKGEGYAVDVAPTAAMAWQYLDAQPYALVIADWRLPDGDGTVIAEAAADLGSQDLRYECLPIPDARREVGAPRHPDEADTAAGTRQCCRVEHW
jgi:CheY-like chemotaxis protein